jgi:acetyltransferase-like isoleucine patch superfamily enzyme
MKLMFARKIRYGMAQILSVLRVAYYRSMGIEIGKHVYISSQAHIDVIGGRITIGNDVSISGGCYILCHTGWRLVKEGERTIIEDNVRIFVNSVILPGMRIGRNSIVGAGSIVMKDVPPNVVVQGNPARVVQRLDEPLGAE